jgi:hypothetical protein
MHAGYEDIIEAAGKAPLWWDQHGVPRFRPHHPDLSADIYACEVVLLRIACQSCLHEQLVQMTWSHGDSTRYLIREEWAALRKGEVVDKTKPIHNLAASARDGTIHYGDPPRHNDERGEFCHAGCTMNVYDLKIEEFWVRKDTADWGWVRVPELEVLLSDGEAKIAGKLGMENL